MLKVIGGEQEGEFKAVASGTLPNGKPVVVNSDGTVSVVQSSEISAGTPVAVTDTAGNKNAAAYDAANQKVVLAWYDAGNSDRGTAVVGTVSGETITFGSETVFETGDTDDLYMIYEPNAQKVVIAYKDVSNSSYGTAIVGTVSGTSISFGTATVFESAQSSEFSMSFDTVENSVLIVYKDVIDNQRGYAVAGQVSGTSITFGTPLNFDTSIVQQTTCSYDSNSGKHLIAYSETTSPSTGRCRLAEITGTSLSISAFTQFTSSGRSSWITSQPVGAGKILLAFCDNGDTDRGKLCCVSIDGSTLTFSSFVQFDEGDIVHIHSAAITDTNEMIIVYSDEDTDNSHFGKFIVATVDGTTPTFTGPVTFESAYTERPAVAYDANAKRAVVSYQDQGNSAYVTACVLNPISKNLTAENYIGMSRGVVNSADAVTGTESVFDATTFGILDSVSVYDPDTQKTIIAYADRDNNDAVTAVVATVTGTTFSFGTPVVADSGADAEDLGIAYDTLNDRVIITYTDTPQTTGYGTAVVGQVSGTSITFGTPVVYESALSYYNAVDFDANSGKVVIAYMDSGNSNFGTAIVGTVSGNSISFGTPVVFRSATSQYMSTVYDPSSQKTVIAYSDRGSLNEGEAVVGTVSGTSISFGSPTVFDSTSGHEADNISAAYDPDTQQVIVAYREDGTPTGFKTHGRAVVGSVSGTSITFGDPASFNAVSTQYIAAGYDTVANKAVIAYRDRSNSDYGTVVAGTVEGTSLTFETPTVYSGTDAVIYIGASFNESAGSFVISYRDMTSLDGTAVAYQASYIQRYPVADGDRASLDIIGSVSTNQLSLTAGEKYYVQTDGTLSTTAGTPSVLAGTAISATKLVVKT